MDRCWHPARSSAARAGKRPAVIVRCFAILLFALLSSPGAGSPQPAAVTITITGSKGATFAGDCTVMMQTGSQKVRLEGTVPETYELTGSGVSCEVRQTGQGGSLVVEVRRNGTMVSHSSMTGGGGRLSITVQ